MNDLNVLYIGGSFEILHDGHVKLIKNLHDLTEFDLILVGISYNLKEMQIISPDDRYNILESLVEELNLRRVKIIHDINFTTDIPVYTYTVIQGLKKKYKKVSIAVGTDQANDFKNWKHPDIINDLIRYKICVIRNGQIPEETGFRIINIDPIPYSSSKIKQECIENPTSINYIVPHYLSYPKTASLVSKILLTNIMK